MKETKVTYFYANGREGCVTSYDNGKHAMMWHGGSLGENNPECVAALKADACSFHQYSSANWLPSADETGIKFLVPAANEIAWEGSAEYAAYEAAKGRRNRKKSGESSGRSETPATPVPAVPATPTVATADAFKVPAIEECPDLKQIVTLMPALADSINAWSAALAAAYLAGEDLPGMPEDVESITKLMPTLSGAVKTYEQIIIRSAEDYKDKLAAEEAARLAAEEAAKKAAEAAANGEVLVKLLDGSQMTVKGKPHAAFAKVATLLKKGRNVYMYGPAGTGKSIAAKQLAGAFGLEFFPFGKIDDIYTTLLGNPDVNGNYVASPFYKAYTTGGFAFFDEVDASDPSAVTWLNGAIENGFAVFPVVGRVDMHPDFKCLAAGNTIGLGADNDYTGRNQLDQAFRRRFAFIEVGYDLEIDKLNAGGDNELLDFMLAVREAVKTCGLSLIVSSAEIKWLHEFDGILPDSENLNINLFKGLAKDYINQIYGAVRSQISGRWLKALKEIAA